MTHPNYFQEIKGKSEGSTRRKQNRQGLEIRVVGFGPGPTIPERIKFYRDTFKFFNSLLEGVFR